MVSSILLLSMTPELKDGQDMHQIVARFRPGITCQTERGTHWPGGSSGDASAEVASRQHEAIASFARLGLGSLAEF